MPNVNLDITRSTTGKTLWLKEVVPQHYKKTLFFAMSKKTAVRVRFDMEVLGLDVT